MDKEYKGEIYINGKVLPITSCSFSISDHTEMLLMYNGQILPFSQVPECETSLCEEKATQPCVLCLTPICNGHASMATKEHICQYCRLSQWMYLNGKGVV
jgi:hypothetical protein